MEKRPPTGMHSVFGDAIFKKGSPTTYTKGKVSAGSENRGGEGSSTAHISADKSESHSVTGGSDSY